MASPLLYAIFEHFLTTVAITQSFLRKLIFGNSSKFYQSLFSKLPAIGSRCRSSNSQLKLVSRRVIEC